MSITSVPSGVAESVDNKGRFKYPNPFFDIASTYIPPSIKTLFRYTKYFYYSNSIISPVIYKLSEYPITNLIYEKARGEQELSSQTREVWERLLEENLKLRRFQIEINLDYNVYGNCFVSIFYPFIRMLECPVCGKKTNVKKVQWKFTRWKFRGNCPACRAEDQEFKVVDKTIKNRKQVKLVRWNPMNISIDFNTITGKSTYIYQIPNREKNNIMAGKEGYIDTVPWVFVEAVKEGKNVELETENLFHFKRASISDSDMGWGMPIILPVIKLAYYLQVLRKGQECVSPSSLLETEHGLVAADNVSVGDMVRTHLGRWRRVKAKWYRDARDGEMGRKITVTGLRPFSATYSPQHPMISIMRNQANLRSDTKLEQRSSKILRNPHLFEEAACPAKDISVGSYLLYPRYLPDGVDSIDVAKYSGMTRTDDYVYSSCSEVTAQRFEALERGEHIPHDSPGRVAKRLFRDEKSPMRMKRHIRVSEDLAYVLGWYVGDGSCGARCLSFSLGDKDDPVPLMDALRRVFGKEPAVYSSSSSDRCFKIEVHDVMAKKFVKGLIPGTARNKRVPEEILNSSNQIRLAFLKGLFEADGCVDDRRATLASSSKDLSYDTYRMLMHLGCISTVQKHSVPESTLADGRKIRTSTSYHTCACNRSRDRLVALWGDTDAPEVKSGKSGFFWKDYFATRVCDIEEKKEKAYIDFSIDEDATFCMPGSAVKNCIAIGHIVPLRILFPQHNADTSPYVSVDLGSWRKKVEAEIMAWRQDPNRVSVMPVPVGVENLGGDARALMITNEIKLTEQEMAGGMGVPIEMIFGGMNWSGSSISLRILENHFLTIIEFHNEFFEWLTTRLSRFFKLPKVKVRQGKFKMADDVQYKQLMLNMQQAGNVSSTTMLEEHDLQFTDEQELIKKEQQTKNHVLGMTQIQNAEIQGQLSVIQAKYSAIAQMEAQKIMQSMQSEMAPQPGMEGAQPGPGGQGEAQPAPSGGPPAPEEDNAMQANQNMLTIPQMVEQYTQQLLAMPPEHREMYLQRMDKSMPQLAIAIRQRMTEIESTRAKQDEGSMEPLPEQRAPRRANSPV